MKKTSLAKRFIPLSIIIVILAAGWGLVFANIKRQSAPTSTDQIKGEATIPTNNETEAEKVETVDLSNLSMPTLMYHHIREYSFEKDEIGTQLSVSPSTFAKQLDDIAQKGYQTTTFSDLANGNMPAKPIILTFDDGYQNFYDNAFPELKKRNMKAELNVITSYVGRDGYVTNDEIIELSENGIEIGAHTVTHPDLSKISEESAKKEIFESKSQLENLLGTTIVTFCYPSGKYNDSIEALTKEAGYKFAITTENKLSTFNKPFSLQRYRVNRDTNISGYLK
ncbi:MAG: polysaccharide deacetylase family protein [Patescibacteria group bacterium]|jgi:peptidoglycan/xylan/chitin deacetylase (PgdA/CDA1 family)